MSLYIQAIYPNPMQWLCSTPHGLSDIAGCLHTVYMCQYILLHFPTNGLLQLLGHHDVGGCLPHEVVHTAALTIWFHAPGVLNISVSILRMSYVGIVHAWIVWHSSPCSNVSLLYIMCCCKCKPTATLLACLVMIHLGGICFVE